MARPIKYSNLGVTWIVIEQLQNPCHVMHLGAEAWLINLSDSTKTINLSDMVTTEDVSLGNV